MFISHRQNDWPEWIAGTEFAYNNKIHTATHISPFFANYEMNPRMGIEPRRAGKSEPAKEFADPNSIATHQLILSTSQQSKVAVAKSACGLLPLCLLPYWTTMFMILSTASGWLLTTAIIVLRQALQACCDFWMMTSLPTYRDLCSPSARTHGGYILKEHEFLCIRTWWLDLNSSYVEPQPENSDHQHNQCDYSKDVSLSESKHCHLLIASGLADCCKTQICQHQGFLP